MAFGINRDELHEWKTCVKNGEIAFLTHYWTDKRFPGCVTVTKVGCSNIQKLIHWGNKYELSETWIHYDKNYPHFDLFGDVQKAILRNEGKWDHISKYNL